MKIESQVLKGPSSTFLLSIYLPLLLSLSVVEPLAPASFNLSEDDEGDAVCDEVVDEEFLCLLDDPFKSLPNNNFLADFFCVICYIEVCLDKDEWKICKKAY